MDNNRAACGASVSTKRGVSPLGLGAPGENGPRMRDFVWKDGHLFPKNHLGNLVKIALSQFYSLENMIQKVKDGVSGCPVAGGLLSTLWEIGIGHLKGLRWNTELGKGLLPDEGGPLLSN